MATISLDFSPTLTCPSTMRWRAAKGEKRPLSSGRSDSALKRAENPQKQGFAAHAPQSRRMGRKRPRRLHRRIKRSVDSPGTLALATFASFRRPLRRRAFAYRAEHSGERADRPAELRRQLVPRLLAQSRRLAPGLRPGPGGPAAGRRGRAAPGRGRRSAGRRRAGLRMGRALCRRRLGLRLAALVRRPPLGDLLERTMCRPTRQRFRGRLLRLGEMSEDDAQPLHRDSAPSSRADEGRRKTGVLRDALRRLAMTTWPPRLTAARTTLVAATRSARSPPTPRSKGSMLVSGRTLSFAAKVPFTV